MAEFTPTTEQVERDYLMVENTVMRTPRSVGRAEFDRWLAEIIRAAKEAAWDEGHRFTGYEPTPGENPYRTAERNPDA